MDNEQERARDRLRKAAGNLPDAAAVQVRVGDLLLALKAFDEAEDADEAMSDMVSPKLYNEEVTGLEEECERLEARIAELERMLGEALLAA